MKENRDVLQGTQALRVLKTLDVLGPPNGYGIVQHEGSMKAEDLP